jgi:hypothetical protein
MEILGIGPGPLVGGLTRTCWSCAPNTGRSGRAPAKA